MTHDVVTVAHTTPIAEIAHLLEARRIKRVPVTRDGRLVGIVSRRNLLQALATRLSAPPVTADDRAIRDAFHAELRRQAWAGSPGAINAVVADGVVHLWGVVPDETLRQAIVVAAENIPGVRAVEDHMDRKRVIDPLDRPNWPSAGAAVALSRDAEGAGLLLRHRRRHPLALIRPPGELAEIFQQFGFLDRLFRHGWLRMRHHRVWQTAPHRDDRRTPAIRVPVPDIRLCAPSGCRPRATFGVHARG